MLAVYGHARLAKLDKNNMNENACTIWWWSFLPCAGFLLLLLTFSFCSSATSSSTRRTQRIRSFRSILHFITEQGGQAYICKKGVADKSMNHNYMNGKEISNAGKFMQPIIGRCSVFLFLWELVFLFLDTVIYNNVHGVVRTHD